MSSLLLTLWLYLFKQTEHQLTQAMFDGAECLSIRQVYLVLYSVTNVTHVSHSESRVSWKRALVAGHVHIKTIETQLTLIYVNFLVSLSARATCLKFCSPGLFISVNTDHLDAEM